MIPAPLLLLALAQIPAPAAAQGCVTCHGEAGTALAASIHASAGVSCTDCHGGNPKVVADAVEAHGDELETLLDARRAVEVCGNCHADFLAVGRYGIKTDQLRLYRQSLHGIALFERGEERVATCMTCHGSHRILRAADPRSPANPLNQVETCGGCHGDAGLMGEHGLDASIPGTWRQSVHGRALLEDLNLASPACTDCHGAHGAAPPRVADLALVCGHCHTVAREHFLESPHYQATQDGLMSECTSCHGAHRVRERDWRAILSPEEGCLACHDGADDPGAQVAQAFHDVLDGLDREIRAVEEELDHASRLGVFIGDEEGYLQEARALRIQGEGLTHTASLERIREQEKKAMGMVTNTRESLEVKKRRLRDHRIFAAAFVVCALLLAVFLWLYRRDLRT